MINHNHIPNGRGRTVLPQFINTIMVLTIVKREATLLRLSRERRQSLIRSAIELTGFKGLQLRRWIREVLFFTVII